MATDLEVLISEIRSSTPDPLGQLERAAHKAMDLEAFADALLTHFVDACRREGHTWADIGERLGVTRQAVQKRFTVNVDPEDLERFTDRAKTALSQAEREALGLNHNFIGTEHIVLALFDVGGMAQEVLEGVGIQKEQVATAVREIIGAGPAPVVGRIQFTPRAKKVLSEALQEALELGHNYIGTEHLLLALFRGQDGVAKRVLEQLGASQAVVREKVIQTLADRRP